MYGVGRLDDVAFVGEVPENNMDLSDNWLNCKSNSIQFNSIHFILSREISNRQH